MKKQRLAKAAVALFFVLLTAVGLLTLNDYTGSYDELVQQYILKVNLKEYALKLETLGIRWTYGLSLDTPPIVDYIERDHGISPMYVCAPLLSLMDASQWTGSTLWGGVVWLWFMAGVWSLYALTRRLGLSRPMACMATLLVYLSPRLFAQGHYNDKDIVLLALVLLCLWLGVRFLEKTSLGRGTLFSLVGALAANLRVVGLLPWGLIGLCAIVRLSLQKQWSLRKLGVAGGTVLAFVVFYFLFTPATWFDPGEYFRYLLTNTASFRWEGTVYFRGAYFTIPEHKLPRYYLPYMMLVTLPLYVLPFCGLGQIRAIREGLKRPVDFLSQPQGLLLATATLLWLLPIAAFALMQPVVYNGWRHFFFCFSGVALLAAYGMDALWRLCASKAWARRICAAGLCLCFGLTLAGMALNHPYEAVYYNPLASKATMETDYWNSGGTAVLKKLADCKERDQSLPMEVGCYFFDIQNGRFKLSDSLREQITTTVAPDAPYLYYLENYVQIYSVSPPEGYRKLFEVTSYGRLIGTVYERAVTPAQVAP